MRVTVLLSVLSDSSAVCGFCSQGHCMRQRGFCISCHIPTFAQVGKRKEQASMFPSLKPIIETVPSNQSPVHDSPAEVEKFDIYSR